MNSSKAKLIQAGDTVVFEGRPQTVVAVSDEGLWAPYFSLDQDGRVSHVLVQEPGKQAPVPVSAAG